MSLPCRAASLEAFIQARAMGSATNSGGGALTGCSCKPSAAKPSKPKPQPTAKKGANARHASLLAFAEARECGRDPDGKFSTGNTCAGAAAAAAATGAVSGAVKGAVVGIVTGGPAFVKPAAAAGAAVGAVKGLYDNQSRPTRVKNAIDKLGMTEDGVGKLVQGLGGTPNSSADTKNGVLKLTLRDSDGKKTFHVEVNKDRVTVYPRRASGELTPREIVKIKKLAETVTPKSVSVVVKKSSSAYVAKLVRSGFSVAAGTVAEALVASYIIPPSYEIPASVIREAAKKRVHS